MFGRRNPDQPPAHMPQGPREGDIDLDLLPDLPDISPPTREPAPPPEAPPADPAWYAGATAPYGAAAPPQTVTQPLPAQVEPPPPAAPPQPATVPIAARGEAPSPRPKTASESVIGPDDFFDGRYRSERGVRIQGTARGSIESRQYIFVEGGAQVEADLVAEDITVAGTFSGKIECRRRLELTGTGKVQGHVQTALLVVHEGGMLDGELHMRGTGDAPAQEGDQQHGT